VSELADFMLSGDRFLCCEDARRIEKLAGRVANGCDVKSLMEIVLIAGDPKRWHRVVPATRDKFLGG
jgi:hypothetical protein